MNQAELLKLQSFLDSELSEADSKEIQALLERDHEARALRDELRGTTNLLRQNEPVVRLEETRDFYWSRIESRLQRPAEQPRSGLIPGVLSAWRKMLVPLAGAAAAAIALVLSYNQGGEASPAGIVETASEDMGALTFRDHKAGVTMVWLYNREPSTFTEPDTSDTVPNQ